METQSRTHDQPARQSVARLCRALKDLLDAERVCAWSYSPGHQTVSFAADDQSLGQQSTRVRAWSQVPLAEFPAACTALLESRPTTILDAPHDARLPRDLAADLGCLSLHVEPLLADGPVGMVTIEPAIAANNPELHTLVPLLGAGIGRAFGQREAELREGRAQFLLDITRNAIAADDLDEILAGICASVAEETRARRASVFVVTDGRLVPRVSRLSDGSEPASWERLREAETRLPAAEAALQSGRPITAEDPDSPMITEWWAESFGIASCIAVPISDGETDLGVLVLDASTSQRFGPADVELATNVASHTAGILSKARAGARQSVRADATDALRELLDEAPRTRTVHDAAELLAHAACRALGAEHGALLVPADDAPAGELAVLGSADGWESLLRDGDGRPPVRAFALWDLAQREQRPVFVADVAESRLIPQQLAGELGLASYAALPLVAANELLGLIVVGNREGRGEWSAEERELAAQLAAAGTLMLDNAVLRGTQHRRLGELAHQAFHDSLTGLPNRALFEDRLEHAFARTNRRSEAVAVLFLDLDSFKVVNDSFGHAVGDRLLIAVAQRVAACLRPQDTVARLGGDEFTILLEDMTGAEYAERVAERVAECLCAPFVIDGHRLDVTASIGIAASSGEEQDPTELLRKSDLAMYWAKNRGKARYEVFTDEAARDSAALPHPDRFQGPRITARSEPVPEPPPPPQPVTPDPSPPAPLAQPPRPPQVPPQIRRPAAPSWRRRFRFPPRGR